jgi:hypothetical protein
MRGFAQLYCRPRNVYGVIGQFSSDELNTIMLYF